MKAYNTPNHIKKKHMTDNALIEVIFKDGSRFLGETYDDQIQGKGNLYIQEVATISGVFFNNQVGEGELEFNGVIKFEGKFDDEERLASGIITFLLTQETIEITTADGILYNLSFFDAESTQISYQNLPNYRKAMANDYVFTVNEDCTEIMLTQEYDDGTPNGHYLVINFKDQFFWHHFYINGVRTEKQLELYLKSPPYTVLFIPRNTVAGTLPLMRMCSANGNTFESSHSIRKGVTKMFEKDYSFFGGVNGPYKSGQGTLVFNDGCEKAVEFKDDKICFGGIESVFEFVKNFECLKHKDLRFSENVAMIKFMEEIDYFEGKMRKGNSEGKLVIEYRNGWKYNGGIRNFKMHGFAELDAGKWKISGEFVDGEIRYGYIHYATGATYEGQILNLKRSGRGILNFANHYTFRGNFSSDEIMRYDGVLVAPDKKEFDVQFIAIYEFDLGIFVTKMNDLYVYIFANDCVHDAHFIDKLEESGISIRDSLRNII